MKKRKKFIIALVIACIIIVPLGIAIADYGFKNPYKIKPDLSWQDKGYDLSLPKLNKDGWYMVFEDDFEGDDLNQNIKFGENYSGSKDVWVYCLHGIRKKSDNEKHPERSNYWCPNSVEVKNSNLVIHSRFENNHKCDGSCGSQGRFSGGIENNHICYDSNGNKLGENVFNKPYGYFECRAKLPNAKGMWSAFWITTNSQGKIGNEGEDGTEIDIFESSFINRSKNYMGHALIWDGYAEHCKSDAYVGEVEKDLYDGYHTYALKWTPEYYVFYVDGKPHYATNAGNVSKVPEFMRFTVEIDTGDKYGPHSEFIGRFREGTAENGDFLVDYVKVWQNEGYEK